MKILIIESGEHEQILHKFLTIIPKSEEIIILGKEERKNWFSKDVLNSYHVELARKLSFWQKASALSKDVRRVIIYTPPEYMKGTLGFIELLFFFWYVRKYHAKISILVKNNTKWQKTSFFSRMRNFTIRYLKDSIIYESEQLQKNLNL